MKRREFLSRSPLALAVVGMPVAAMTPVQNFAEVAENPALAILGKAVMEAEQAYVEAKDAWFTAWREWQPQWPLAPDCCVDDYAGPGSSDIERTILGGALIRKGKMHPMRLHTEKHLQWRIDTYSEARAKDVKRKRKASKRTYLMWKTEIEQAQLGLELLPGYLAKCQRIRDESRMQEIDKARHTASRNLFAAVRLVLSEPSHTMAGIKIKAQAAAAISRMNPYDDKWSGMHDSIGNRNLAGLLGQALIDAI